MNKSNEKEELPLECHCGGRPTLFRQGASSRTYIECVCGKRCYQDPMWEFAFFIDHWQKIVGPKPRGEKGINKGKTLKDVVK